MVKASDAIRHCASHESLGAVMTLTSEEYVDEECGIDVHYIKRWQAKEMLSGKLAYFTDGEYAHLIIVEAED